MRALFCVLFGLTLAACQSTPPVPEFRDATEIDHRFASWLSEGKYRELDAAYVAIAKAYREDSAKESRMDAATRAFYRPGMDWQPKLDEWVKRFPDSAVARLARGVFYAGMGWDRRGVCSADQTGCAKFDAMHKYHALAISDLEAAIKLDPGLVHALLYRMEVALAAGDRDTRRAMHDRALALNPLSLTARFWYITGLLPRWGGSIEEMQAEISAARSYYERNPALKVLEGRIAAEKGDDAFYDQQDFRRAAMFYSQALKSGSHPFYHHSFAAAMSELNLGEFAIKEADLALADEPNDFRARYVRGVADYQKHDLSAAIADFTFALEGNPSNVEARGYRGLAYAEAGNARAALADFESAYALFPDEYYRQKIAEMKRRLAVKQGDR
jgi:tetratricopeptide (TPR) repeat protein